MGRKKLSLCIISKNEESLIRNAIESVKEVVDEIILIDTGSKDKTIEIAKELGAKIYNEDFYYDFSDIRNKGIEKATGDWILFLDCDEKIQNKYDIYKVLEEVKDEVCISMRVCSYLDSVKRNENNIIRLFKKDERIKFEGRIHESIEKSVIENFGIDKIKYTDLEIQHYGSDKNIVDVKEKLRRNLKVFSLMGDEEKDCKYYFDIGNEYGRMFDFELALENYDKAFEIYDSNKLFKASLILNKAKAMHKLGLFDMEIEFLDKSIKEYEDFKDLYFLKCLCEVQLGNFKIANESLEKYMELEKNIKYPSSEFERVIDIKSFYDNIKEISAVVKF